MIEERRLMGRIPQRAIQQRNRASASAPAPDPKSYYIGDVAVPWNVGETIYRYKAPRAVRISDVTIDVADIISPSGCPVVIEIWLNGTFRGTVPIAAGANAFDPFPLSKLDEVEMRIVVKGERDDVTEVRGMWVLYCVS